MSKKQLDNSTPRRSPQRSVSPDSLAGLPESYHPLDPQFFSGDTVTIAQALLGHLLIRRHPETGLLLPYRIVETEAYTQNDPACHAYQRATGRAATLYKAPGLAYVYLIYGMYHCLNVVTEPEGTAGAVLFRALEPLHPDTPLPMQATHGPGRLAKALDITKLAFNEQPLTCANQPLFLAHGVPVWPQQPEQVVTATRIGISAGADLPWRFYVKDNPWVSVKLKGSTA
jgi:DNA-3-methyladenine glycosylase